MFQEGTNIKTVQKIAGHGSIEMMRRAETGKKGTGLYIGDGLC